MIYNLGSSILEFS